MKPADIKKNLEEVVDLLAHAPLPIFLIQIMVLQGIGNYSLKLLLK